MGKWTQQNNGGVASGLCCTVTVKQSKKQLTNHGGQRTDLGSDSNSDNSHWMVDFNGTTCGLMY